MGIHIVKFGDIERFGMANDDGNEKNSEDKIQRLKEMVTAVYLI